MLDPCILGRAFSGTTGDLPWLVILLAPLLPCTPRHMDRLKQHELGHVSCSGGSPCGTGTPNGRHMLPLH
eukprot:8844560-Lingulodinium_polyedra.AAC.1